MLGLSFVFVAFTEKFANLPLAQSFLDRYPLNFTSALSVPLPDEVFVLCRIGRATRGAFLTFGIFARETVIFALVPVDLTLTLFNYTEIVGHLPIYGALAVLPIWEPGRKNLSLWLRGVRIDPSASLATDGDDED